MTTPAQTTIPWDALQSVKEKSKPKTPSKPKLPTVSFDDLPWDDTPPITKWRGQYFEPDLMVIDSAPRTQEAKTFFPWSSMGACDVATALKAAGYDVGDFHEVLALCAKKVRYDDHSWSPEWAATILNRVDAGNVLWYHIDHEKIQDKDLPKGHQSDDDSLARGLAKMHWEIVSRIKPRHILILGGRALYGMLGFTNPLEKSGIRYRYQFPKALDNLLAANPAYSMLAALKDVTYDCPVDVDIDPGQIIADGSQKSFGDRVRINLNRPEVQEVSVRPPLTIFHTFEESLAFLIRLKEENHKELAYDLETSSLNPTAHPDGNIVSVHFAYNTERGYSVPIDHPDCPFTREQQLRLLRAVGDILMQPRECLIGHNLLFDNLCTRTNPHTGINRRRLPAKLIDSMLFVYCMDEAGPRGLKENCNIYTDMQGYDDELDAYKKAHKIECYRDIPWKILSTYGGWDPVATLKLLAAVRRILATSEMECVSVVAESLMPVQAQALEDMAVNGQCIDLHLLHHASSEAARKIAAIEESFHTMPEMVEFRELCRQRNAREEALVRMTKPMISAKVASENKVFTAPNKKELAKLTRDTLKAASEGFKTGAITVDEDMVIIGVDNPDLKEKLETIYAHHAANAYESLRDYKVNLNGNGSQEIGDFFYKHLKIPVEVLTDKKNPSLDYEAMEAIGRYHPCAKDFGRYKDEVKISGTFFKPLVTAFDAYKEGRIPDYAVSPAGFTHFSIRVGSTVTGRTAGTYLQQAPAGIVKKLFKSRFVRGVIPQGDLSQVELRVLAAISRDPDMCKVYREGGDLHTLTATKLFGDRFTQCKDPKLKKKLRSGAKRVNFGLAYGIGAEGLVGTIKDEGVDCLVLGGLDPDEIYADTERMLTDAYGRKPTRVEIEQAIHPVRVQICQDMLDKFFQAYPGVKAWVDETHEFIKFHGWVPNVFGRIRRLPSGVNNYHRQLQNEALRQGQNFPVQSAASDMMLVCVEAIEQEILGRGLRSVPWALVHDSSEFDSPIEEASEVAEIMLHYKRNPHLAFQKVCPDLDMDWLTVPMEADVGIGPNWGVEYKYQDGKIRILALENGDNQDLWVPTETMWEALDDIKDGKYAVPPAKA